MERESDHFQFPYYVEGKSQKPEDLHIYLLRSFCGAMPSTIPTGGRCLPIFFLTCGDKRVETCSPTGLRGRGEWTYLNQLRDILLRICSTLFIPVHNKEDRLKPVYKSTARSMNPKRSVGLHPFFIKCNSPLTRALPPQEQPPPYEEV